jgi:hypothetical protein
MPRQSLLALLVSIVLPSAADAQAVLTGLVCDSSGAALRGVAVEASSPRLIERVRSAVTDATGRFAILDLRPGVYDVRFTLAGFTATTREGVELTGSFVTDLTVELTVGAIDQTIRVEGVTPIVDVRGKKHHVSMTADLIAALPTGRSLVNLGILIPGMTPFAARSQNDVGGTNNLQNMFMAIHGGRITDQRTYVDGVTIRNLQSEGHATNFTPDMGSTQEVTIDYAAAEAEDQSGGVRANYVPREGGNRFQVSFFGTAADSSFQASNLTRELSDRGLAQPDALKLTYDVNPAAGGPLVKETLWFYAAARAQSNQNYVAIFENLNAGDPAAWTYEPDTHRRGLFAITQNSGNLRLTWQPTPRHKLSGFIEKQWRVWDEGNVNRSPEAFSRFRFPQNQLAIVGWSSPLSDRLLADARASSRGEAWRNIGADDLLANNRSLVPVLEQGGAFPGLMYRAKSGPYAEQSTPLITVARASVAFVTGAHAFKAGGDLLAATNTNRNTFNDSGLQYRFNNGVPNQITEYATPYDLAWTVTEAGLFAQDRWTGGRYTLSGGLRLDYFGTAFPESRLGPATLLPERDITLPALSWYGLKDLSPRLGLTYDVFGNGKTALRASADRYVVALPPATGHPVNNLALSVTRSWTDANNNVVPDCEILNPQANRECGMISDLNFGGATPSTTYDPAIRAGWNVRPFNWEFSTGVQHELRPEIALNAALFRRVYGNFTVQDNLATTAGDYTRYSVPAPVDPRLPGGGGYPVGGLVDVNPEKRGQVRNYVTSAKHYGRQIEHWNGVDLGVNVRVSRIVIQGGVSTGRTSTDVCGVAARVPEVLGTGGALSVRQIAWSLDQCHVDTKFLTQTKWRGTYTLPRIDVQFAGTVASTPGPEIQANYVATNAVVQPALGRPLTGTANATVWLLDPGTAYGERLTQIDARVAKAWRAGRLRAALNFDLYNLLNANPVTAMNLNYSGAGAGWLQPQAILAARLFKLSLQIDY